MKAQASMHQKLERSVMRKVDSINGATVRYEKIYGADTPMNVQILGIVRKI